MATFQLTTTVTGDGTTTTFAFPHGLMGTPAPYSSCADATTQTLTADYGGVSISADGSNITLDFGSNPPAHGVVLTYNLAGIL